MKRERFVIFLAIIQLLTFSLGGAVTGTSLDSDQPVGLIVKFKADVDITVKSDGRVSPNVALTGVSRIDKLNAEFGVSEFKSALNLTPEMASTHPFGRVYTLTTAVQNDLEALKAEYEVMNEVEYVEYDYPLEMLGTIPLIQKKQIDDSLFISIPNDQHYEQQWYLHNTGQEHVHIERYYGCNNDSLTTSIGLEGADINAQGVFENPPDQTVTVVVAIIDSGVDMDYPELADKIWSNYREADGNGIDDDNNGYVDDVHGWDFSAVDTLVHEEDNDPTDEHGHGTHCAGIVAAEANNHAGIAGICPDVAIMPLKVFPLAIHSKLARAIIYAADNDADVVNMSLGTPYASNFLEEAINYAKDKGVILCAAMGNSGSYDEFIPAIYDATIGVGATNDQDQVTSFSTYGNHIDIVAPGLAMLSLRADYTDMYAEDCEPIVHIYDSTYYIASGTSMACPTVVGVAAYLRAVSPGVKPDVAQDILEQSAYDYVDPYGNGANLPGWDMYSGYGRVDLGQTLQNAPAVRAKIDFPKWHETLGGYVIISGIADGADFESYTVEYGAGDNPTEWIEITTSTTPISDNYILGTWITGGLIGQYTIRLRVGDDHMDMVTFYLNPAQVAEITSPSETDTVCYEAKIIGSSYSVSYESYSVDFRPVGESQWEEIGYGTIPKYDEELATWYTSSLPIGDYVLRLRTYWVSGLVATDTVVVYVDPSYVGDNWTVNLGASGSLVPTYGDIDNDGLNEYIIGTMSGIKFYNINGSEKTINVPTVPDGDYRIPIAVGNLDGDGIDDFVGVNLETSTIWGYRSDGGDFAIQLDTPLYVFSPLIGNTDNNTNYISLKDIDNDGIDEIYGFFLFHKLVWGEYRSRHSNFVLEVTDTEVAPLRDYTYHLLAADLENDGTVSLYDQNDGLIREVDRYGNVLNSIGLSTNEESFSFATMSFYDIGGDDKLEIIITGRLSNSGHWVWALDENLVVESGWPHQMNIDAFYVPTTPMFGDIDNDGQLEYVSSYYDMDYSHLYIWNIDGTPYVPGSDGFVRTFPYPTIANYPLLADIDADGWIDILQITRADLWFTTPGEKLLAFDHNGNVKEGYPITLNASDSSHIRNVPLIGDMSQDGNVDITVLTSKAELVFMNFAGAEYDPCKAPVRQWRYNRTLDFVGPSEMGDCSFFICGDVNYDGIVDSLDLDYLIAYLFEGGPPPNPMESGDINCDPGIDMSDVTFMISYLYMSGPAPCDCETMVKMSESTMLSLDTEFSEGYTILTLNSEAEIMALEVEVEGKIPSSPTCLSQLGLEIFSGHDNNSSRVALFDVNGNLMIEPGQVLKFEGKVSIMSAMAVDGDGFTQVVKVDDNSLLPKDFVFNQNYPNPFNPATTFSFALPEDAAVRLEIYNILGQKVTTVINERLTAGRHEVVWNGTDANGGSAASGIYFAKFKAGSFTSTKKLSLLK